MTEQRQQVQLLTVALGAFAVLSLMMGGNFVSKDYGALPTSYESTPADYRGLMTDGANEYRPVRGLATQQVGPAPENAVVTCGDRDRDGFFSSEPCGTQVDCNDFNRAVNPGARELCGDGIDNNCNGIIDERCSIREPSLNCPSPEVVPCNQPRKSLDGRSVCEGAGTACPAGFACQAFGCAPA